jgi:hypothetical protein
MTSGESGDVVVSLDALLTVLQIAGNVTVKDMKAAGCNFELEGGERQRAEALWMLGEQVNGQLRAALDSK